MARPVRALDRWSRAAAVLGASFTLAWTAPTMADTSSAPAGSDPPSLLILAGSSLTGYRLAPELLASLERGRVPVPDTLPFVLPPDVLALGETLSLGEPVFSHPLPGEAAEVLAPRRRGEPLYAATRGGLARFDLSAPAHPPAMLLAGWDLCAVATLGDGTILALERGYDEDFRGAVPAPLLALSPDGGGVPDTLAVCSAGSMRILVAPGDTLLWITRINGRTLDRIRLRGGVWEKREIAIVPQVWNEDRFSLRIGVAPYGDGVLVLDQGRGQRPRLLQLGAEGPDRELYIWPRGFRPYNSAWAPGDSLLVLNGVTNLSLLDLSASGQYSYTPGGTTTCAGVSFDGGWLALSYVQEGGTHSVIELRRRGGYGVARVRQEGVALFAHFIPRSVAPLR